MTVHSTEAPLRSSGDELDKDFPEISREYRNGQLDYTTPQGFVPHSATEGGKGVL